MIIYLFDYQIRCITILIIDYANKTIVKFVRNSKIEWLIKRWHIMKITDNIFDHFRCFRMSLVFEAVKIKMKSNHKMCINGFFLLL